MMIDLGHQLINTDHIAFAELDTRHYMNGSETFLIIRMVDGQRLILSHRTIDIWEIYDKIKGKK